MKFHITDIRTWLMALLMLVPMTMRAQLEITEIMQSNIDCLMDDINEFPDSWVEVYNTTNSTIQLSGFSIGLTDNPDEAWKLPVQSLMPSNYLVIYCDKEADGLHTDFRLESGNGGSIYLFQNNTVIDKLENLPKQPAPNVSYGRLNAASDTWGYQKKATPKMPNCEKFCTEVLGEPIFETEGQVFEKSGSYKLTISLPEDAPEGTEIRYTCDGTEPLPTSALYTKSITYNSTRVVRAKLFCDGYLTRPSTVHSYIVHPREVTFPVVSIVTDKTYFYDTKKGIYVDGTYSSSKKNYEYDWRRPINFEYFAAPGEKSEVNQLCEARVAGAASRGAVLKSLAMFANKRFGKKHFKYEFFADDRPEEKDFKSIMIRNAGNDFDYLYMRDAMIQRSIARHLDIDYQAYQPAIFYLNGTYMGIMNVRERGNENNIYTNYDHLEDIDMFENWYSLKQGTWDNLNAFTAFYTEHGHTLDEYRQWMDIDEYINYMAMNAYYNNLDFPANNVMMWRPRTDDGRWRFIAKDVDYTIGIYGDGYNYQYFSWINNNSFDSNRSWGNTYDATRLFRRLMEVTDFKNLFLERMAIYMGSFLNYDHVWKEVWEPMYNVIKTEYPYHREPINKWWPNYADELSNAQSWMKSRTSFLYKHMADYYEMGTMPQMVVNDQLSDEEKAAVGFSFNDINLCGGSFDGQFFTGHDVTLKGTVVSDKTVVGWSVFKVGSAGTSKEEIEGDTYSFQMPDCSRLQINAILGNAEEAGIAMVNDGESGHSANTYNINGQRVEGNYKGIIIKNGRKYLQK